MPLRNAIPIYEPGKAWTDETLTQCFHSGLPVRKVHLYGLLAQRADRHPAFLELLRADATAQDNREAVFFGFIKMAWLPVLAVLEHGDDALKAELRDWLLTWRAEERQFFMDYLSGAQEATFWME